MAVKSARSWLLLAAMLVAGSIWTPVRAQSAAAAPVRLWRLDCGSVFVPDLDFLSDSFAFSGTSRTLTVSCYLISDGNRYLLWDTGLPLSRLGEGGISVGGGRAVLARSIVDQLREIGVDPGEVRLVALSHYHSDHSGQAAAFPAATLLIGAQDMAVVRGSAAPFNLQRGDFAPWLSGGGRIDEVAGDRDVFGDGRVVMLSTPGHTPGHHSLLVRLASGPVILSGDLWHFAEQMAVSGVPKVNTSRAETLASMDRVARIAAALRARIIIGHEPADIARLPAFPAFAR
jgi:glyoxylase-like metal-dependent hydrolase (beta-lactamase superfamily II)